MWKLNLTTLVSSDYVKHRYYTGGSSTLFVVSPLDGDAWLISKKNSHLQRHKMKTQKGMQVSGEY